MERIPRLLIISRDQMLLQTRQWILEAFFHVDGADKIEEAESMILQYKFDLIVLCHSLPFHESQRVLDLVKQRCPETKILMLAIPGCDCVGSLSNSELVTEFGPSHLLKTAAAMVGIDLKQRAPSLNLDFAPR